MTFGDGSRVTVPDWLRAALDRIEREARLDPAAGRLGRIARPVGAGRHGALLRGQALGHALHPLMTDFPLGCWMAASLVDLLGPRGTRLVARRLVGLGLLATVPTALTGLAEYGQVRSDRVRRVGTVHALGNAAVSVVYLMSWRSRRRGHQARGIALGLLGGSGAWVTGYLGGHLSFARHTGTGQRGMLLDPV